MDLLETVLRAANAEKYIKHFRQNNVDASTLRILTDDDLQILGVDDEGVRESILKHARNLQIPSEKTVALIFDNEYIEETLDQINSQLAKHVANISCANLRKDVVVCDIQLSAVTSTLRKAVSTLQNSLNAFEQQQMIPTQKKRNKRTLKYLLSTAVATVLLIFICKRSVLLNG